MYFPLVLGEIHVPKGNHREIVFNKHEISRSPT